MWMSQYGTLDAISIVPELLLRMGQLQRWQKEQGMVDDITIIVAYLKIDPSKQYANRKKF